LRKSRLQYSLFSLLGLMFAVAFFFAWLRVNTEFKFILFGLVIMPAIAIGLAMLAGMMPKPRAGLENYKPPNLRPVYESIPPSILAATHRRNAARLAAFAAGIAVLIGIGWMYHNDPGSAVWYYGHRSALGLAIFAVAVLFIARSVNDGRLGDELVPLESPYHELQRRGRFGLLGMVPMATASLVQYVQHPNTPTEAAMLTIFGILLVGWFANGPSGIFQHGILVRGAAVPWNKILSHYWIPDSDIVVFATAGSSRVPHPMWFQFPADSITDVAETLASRIPVAKSAEAAWQAGSLPHEKT
jgi:hypothetical protein